MHSHSSVKLTIVFFFLSSKEVTIQLCCLTYNLVFNTLMVNLLSFFSLSSNADWQYAANEFVKQLPDDVIVHCSEKNINTLTLEGVDVMGERLADEVSTTSAYVLNFERLLSGG
jgi:hypothetical protein